MSNIVKYEANGQEVMLSPDIIKRYLVSGDAGNVTDQEIMMFLKLCEYQKLNPFLREIYIVKYGNNPATMVTGKETFTKRAYRHPKFRGHQTGIIGEDKDMVAWAEVHVEGYACPIRCEVDYEEYVGKTKFGEVNKMWKEKPKTMLKKVALVQALREAFPEDFGGLYDSAEINTIADELPVNRIEVIEAEVITEDQQELLDERKAIQSVEKQAELVLSVKASDPVVQEVIEAPIVKEVVEEFHGKIVDVVSDTGKKVNLQEKITKEDWAMIAGKCTAIGASQRALLIDIGVKEPKQLRKADLPTIEVWFKRMEKK